MCNFCEGGSSNADYKVILRLRSIGCSPRGNRTKQNGVMRQSEGVCEAADRLGLSWPIDDAVTNAELNRMMFTGKY